MRPRLRIEARRCTGVGFGQRLGAQTQREQPRSYRIYVLATGRDPSINFCEIRRADYSSRLQGRANVLVTRFALQVCQDGRGVQDRYWSIPRNHAVPRYVARV